MAQTLPQAWGGSASLAATLDIPVSGFASGDLIHVETFVFGTTSEAVGTPSDNGGNTWTAKLANAWSATFRQVTGIAFAVVGTPGGTPPTTITVRPTTGTPDGIGGTVSRVTGCDTANPYIADSIREQTIQNSSTTAIDTAVANSIVIVSETHDGADTTLTEAAGWSLAFETESDTIDRNTAYQVFSSRQAALTHQWTNGASRDWSMTAVAYRAAATVAAGTPTRAFQEPDAFQPTGFQFPDPSDAFITRLHAFFQEGAFQRPDPTGVFQFQGFDDEGFQSDFEAFYATMFQPRAFQIDEPVSPAYIVSGVGAIGTGEAFGGTDRVVRWLGPGGVTSLEQFGVAHVTRWLGPAAVASAEAFGQSSQLRRILAAVGVAPSEAFGTAKVVRWVGPSGVGSLEQFGTAKAIRLLGPAGVVSGQAFGTAKLIRLIFPLGVASAEAFGRPMEIGGIIGAYQVTGVGAIASLEQFGGADKVIRWVGPGGVVSAQAFGVTKTVRWIGPGGIGSAAALGGPGLLRFLAAQGIASAEAVSAPKLVRRIVAVNITTGEAFGVTTVGPYVASAPGVAGTVAVADQATIRAALADQQRNVAALADGRTVSVVTADGQTWLVSVADTVEINVRISNRPGG